MRRTRTLVEVATALMTDPHGRHWGYDLRKQSGMSSGVMYPILWRMLGQGWLTDGREELAPDARRPPRRYYEVTPEGRSALAALIAGPQAASKENQA